MGLKTMKLEEQCIISTVPDPAVGFHKLLYIFEIKSCGSAQKWVGVG